MLKEKIYQFPDKLGLMRQEKDHFVKQKKKKRNFKFPLFLIFLFEEKNQESKQIWSFLK